MKLLSVIVPSYNMEKYLPKCLGSLVVDPELMDRLEVLVVNDGSKDRTSEIAHEFAAKWPQTFKVIDKENGNYGSCINAALPVVSGKFVRILDADDYVDTQGFEALVTGLESSSADLVVADMSFVDPDGKRTCGDPPLDVTPGIDLPIEQLGDVRFVSIHRGYYRSSIFSGGWYRQLEGISYTDCQWCSIPMLRVRTFRYFPGVVTYYLIGREGQTMNDAVRARNFHQQIQVLSELMRVHGSGRPANCVDGAWKYFENLYSSELCHAYRALLVGVGHYRLGRGLFRTFIQNLEDLDPHGIELVKRNDRYGVIECLRGRIRFNLIKSYYKDPRWLFLAKRLAIMTYLRVRQ